MRGMIVGEGGRSSGVLLYVQSILCIGETGTSFLCWPVCEEKIPCRPEQNFDTTDKKIKYTTTCELWQILSELV